MEIQTNHTLRLLNAKCEYVCIVDNLSKKLDYGDDIECCLNKLFLASKLINRLECYSFPTTTLGAPTSSEFTTTISDTQYDLLLGISELTIQLNVNGTIYDLFSNGADTGLDLIINKLTELGFFVSYIDAPGRLTYMEFILTCDVLSLDFTVQYLESAPVDYPFTNTVPGSCFNYITTIPDNCIEQSNLREMYAVLDNLLS
jgi:hypothetical protein